MMRGPGSVRAAGVAVIGVLVVASGACTGDDEAIEAGTTASVVSSEPSRPDVDDLGDGVHQVRVGAVDLLDGTIEIDGVQVMEGMEAVLAYLADTDGAQLEGAQVYVRNAAAEPTDFEVDAAGSFSVIPADGCCEPLEVGWSAFADAASAGFEPVWGNNPPFEVTISGGRVTEMRQIYTP